MSTVDASSMMLSSRSHETESWAVLEFHDRSGTSVDFRELQSCEAFVAANHPDPHIVLCPGRSAGASSMSSMSFHLPSSDII